MLAHAVLMSAPDLLPAKPAHHTKPTQQSRIADTASCLAQAESLVEVTVFIVALIMSSKAARCECMHAVEESNTKGALTR